MNSVFNRALNLIVGFVLGSILMYFNHDSLDKYDAYVGALVVPGQQSASALVFPDKATCEAKHQAVKELAKGLQGKTVEGPILLSNCIGVKLTNVK